MRWEGRQGDEQFWPRQGKLGSRNLTLTKGLLVRVHQMKGLLHCDFLADHMCCREGHDPRDDTVLTDSKRQTPKSEEESALSPVFV